MQEQIYSTLKTEWNFKKKLLQTLQILYPYIQNYIRLNEPNILMTKRLDYIDNIFLILCLVLTMVQRKC